MDKLKELYKNLTQRERMLFYAAIVVFVIMMTDLIVVGPIMKSINLLDHEIKSKSQSIQRDMRIISFKDRILQEYSRYESYLDTGDQTQEEIIAKLLKKLETLSVQNNIKITNVMPGEIEDKPIYKIYSTSLDFEGSLKDTIVFMNALEESDNLFQISRYVMVPKNKSGQVIKSNMDISRILIAAEDIEQFRTQVGDSMFHDDDLFMDTDTEPMEAPASEEMPSGGDFEPI